VSPNNFLDSEEIIKVAEKTKYFSTQHIKNIFNLSQFYNEFISSSHNYLKEYLQLTFYFLLSFTNFMKTSGVKIQSRTFMHENLQQAEKYLTPDKKANTCICNRIQEYDD